MAIRIEGAIINGVKQPDIQVTHCPECESENITTKNMTIGANGVKAHVVCADCGAEDSYG